VTTRLGRLVPPTPLGRVRLLFLGFALLSLGIAAASMVARRGGSPVTTGIVVVLLGGLGAHWIAGYRREGFPLLAEPAEFAVMAFLLRNLPGDPFVPLLGLVFRSTYGSLWMSLGRYLLWSGALLGAHAPRGPQQMHDDVARVLGMALVPTVMQAFRSALEGLEGSERRLRSLVENSTDVVTVVGEDLAVRWQAESIRAVLEVEPAEIVDRPILELVHPEDSGALERYFHEAASHPGLVRRLALRLRHGAGGHRHFEVVASNRLHDPSVGGYVLNMRDATQRHRLEHELRSLAAEREHDATHDPLTGLANRRKLFARVESALAEARAAGGRLSLLLIDLDHFKELNDTLGHAAGDRLLRDIRPRLAAAAVNADLVARLGGDEFAVLLRPGDGEEEATAIALRLRDEIERPFQVEGLTVHIQASIGIAVFPDQAHDVETLMRRADIAMYSAKARGVGHEVYSTDRDGHSKERLALAGELPEAIATGQVVVHYQPKMELSSGIVCGVEALVRWEHPTRGLLPPAAFLPLVEQTGIMRPLTLHVLDLALGQVRAWRDEGLELRVAVNLSAPNLLDLALPADVAAVLAKWDADPSWLVLEITETIVAADAVRVVEVMNRLRELGVELSLDDFGTGSSSLGYLRRLPVQELKIDKSFVLGMDEDVQNAAIVRATIDLAHSLGLRIVAEGIETETTMRRLRGYGCDQGQGFLLGRPMPAPEVRALALRSHADAAPVLPLAPVAPAGRLAA
jgi:diguanylate cyclase (GGDEF)-like protein/PAS domain S-box-containing protein